MSKRYYILSLRITLGFEKNDCKFKPINGRFIIYEGYDYDFAKRKLEFCKANSQFNHFLESAKLKYVYHKEI